MTGRTQLDLRPPPEAVWTSPGESTSSKNSNTGACLAASSNSALNSFFGITHHMLIKFAGQNTPKTAAQTRQL